MKEDLKQAINSLSTKIMDNRAMLFQARANIEENRLMVLSNYAAAFAGNQQLAVHNTDDIFSSRKTILDSYEWKPMNKLGTLMRPKIVLIWTFCFTVQN